MVGRMKEWSDSEEPDSTAVRVEFALLLALVLLGYVIAVVEVARLL